MELSQPDLEGQLSHCKEHCHKARTCVQSDWNLTEKIRVCAQDNAFNQAAAGKLLEDWEDLPCFANTLQLALNTGSAIEEVKAVIKRCGKLMGAFKNQL